MEQHSPQQPQQGPIQAPGMTSAQKVMFGILGVLSIILMLVGYSAYVQVQKGKSAIPNDPDRSDAYTLDTDDTDTSATEEHADAFETGTDALGVFYRNSPDDLKTYDALFEPAGLAIEWHVGAIPIEDETNIMRRVDAQYPNSIFQKGLLYDRCDDCHVFLFEAGVVMAPATFAGTPLYYMFYPIEGMGIGYVQVLVLPIEEQGKFLVLESNNPELDISYPESAEQMGWFIGQATADFSSVYTYPTEIYIPAHNATVRHKLAYKKKTEDGLNLWVSAGVNNAGGIYDVTEQLVASFNPKDEIVHQDPTYGPVFYDGFGYYIVLQDGAIQQYDLVPDFFTAEEAAPEKSMYIPGEFTDIVWNAGIDNAKDRYIVGGKLGSYGCGNNYLPLTSVVSEEEWFDETKLAHIGTTKNGAPVYEATNPKENKYYTDLFQYGYFASQAAEETRDDNGNELYTEEEKYQRFVADHPVFFWQGPANTWRVFHKAKYQSLAECGKPVVYLYPEETTAIHVQVAPNGGFTKTDPLYPDGGWNVIAHPDGRLEYPKNGQEYPYLFWEGHANGFQFREQGFVIAKKNVPTETRELLYKAGLNIQEAEDFMEFWQERMMASPYVFVTFVDQRTFEKAAPLSIVPKPDTTIRVMMNFEPLDAWKDVEPLSIRTPKRVGYTAVEWGGVIQ
ncbi:MAG: hypothetical protein COU33_00385 [Candidatus Magasanikbacteria bacterium CG10_big_fil_rev_8_21_14_0_10_43_6]|uniref:Uncharacterized protein n=1 Tax=Candidatus Magasanikbacteria bacterium CG10_big_fil_rev_8_21_14_0_10_43_6 TaxID=1974650 RepID=A0A2M6W2C8_9BACT|nr:MAG: hypothetical protein COU33_00385 [Candidatus Magasanikbacteria bacterium CG10_big_fil_rev_8_21_14_0_10_43_6]